MLSFYNTSYWILWRQPLQRRVWSTVSRNQPITEALICYGSVPCNSEWNKPITKRIISLFAAWVFGWQRFWFQQASFSPVRFNPNNLLLISFYHRRNYFKTGSLSTARPCQNKNDTISRVALIKSLRHDNTQKVLLDGPCGTLPLFLWRNKGVGLEALSGAIYVRCSDPVKTGYKLNIKRAFSSLAFMIC